MKTARVLSVCVVAVCCLASSPRFSRAEIAITVNDNKWVLVDGVAQAPVTVVSDTISLIDLDGSSPRLLTELEVPGSVIGPPLSVAITPDGGLALITACMKLDPATRTLVENNQLSVVDLKTSPIKVIATVTVGTAPAGLSINRAGTLALVANRGDGTVSVLSIAGKKVTQVDRVTVAPANASVSHVTIAPDGRRALVTRYGDNTITLLDIDGTKVTLAGRDMHAGLQPYAADISRNGNIAVVGNVGLGQGDNDTISVIDLRAAPPRVVNTVTVPQTPEGLKLSPDGTLCAVVTMNGSNKPPGSPFLSGHGLLVLFRIDGTHLTKVGETSIGHWSQGVAFSADSRTLLVTNMVEKDVQVLTWDGSTLRDTGQRISVSGGPAAIRTTGN